MLTKEARLVSPEEASKILGVPKSWVYTQCREGRLPHHKIGKYLRIDLADIDNLFPKTGGENADES